MAVDWDKMVLGPLMGEFGEPATYMPPAAGTPVPISGVFDEAYLELELQDDGSSINTTNPVLGVQLSAFPVKPVQGGKVFINSVNTTFVIRDVRPDGHGEAKLMLNFVSSP